MIMEEEEEEEESGERRWKKGQLELGHITWVLSEGFVHLGLPQNGQLSIAVQKWLKRDKSRPF